MGMPGLARLDAPGVLHHVNIRGIERVDRGSISSKKRKAHSERKGYQIYTLT